MALLLLATGCGEEPTFEIAGCRVTDAVHVGADDAPLGFSAREVVAAGALAGGQTLQYGWEGQPGPAVDLELGIEAADLSRVRWVREAYVIGGDLHPRCPQGLTFPADVVVRTADGQFDERLRVDVFATAVDEHEWYAVRSLEDLSGSYEPKPRPPPSKRWDKVPTAVSFNGYSDGARGSWGYLYLWEQLWETTAVATFPIAYWGDPPQE